MPLNKVKPGSNMYQFISHTWNPMGGECFHKCIYCSTNKFYYPQLKSKYAGEVRLEEKYLNDQLGRNNFIFVCAQHDLFAENVQVQWINAIIEHCRKFNNRYLFQTKNPTRIKNFKLPLSSFICTTIESDSFYPEIMGNSPHPMERSIAMQELNKKYTTYVTIEPILEFNLEHMVKMIKRCNPKQVNVGADSGNNHLPEPSKDKILDLITELSNFTLVKEKTNLKRLLK